MRKQELISMLQCKLCDGLYRFAHTLVDCGHTFCQICILAYIKTFKGKNPQIKCPQCHAAINQNYRRSIIKDVFKQNLVDLITPQFVEQDSIIIKRVQTLFPEFDLEFLLDEFTFSTFEVPSKTKKRMEEKSNIQSKLSEKIKQKLGVSFETFAEAIVKEQQYQNYINIIHKKNTEPTKKIQIKPKTERDYQYVGISNQIKTDKLTVTKIKRFLEKKALDKLSKNEDIPKQWINSEGDRLEVQIFVSLETRSLKNEDNLQQVLQQNLGPIYYSLSDNELL